MDLLPNRGGQLEIDRRPITNLKDVKDEDLQTAIEKIQLDADKKSIYYGKLLKISLSPVSSGYMIGLSDRSACDFGWYVRSVPLPSKAEFVMDGKPAYPPKTTFERMIHAIRCFKHLPYDTFQWNSEHYARLIATNEAVSYQVKKIPFYGNGRNEKAESLFQEYLKKITIQPIPIDQQLIETQKQLEAAMNKIQILEQEVSVFKGKESGKATSVMLTFSEPPQINSSYNVLLVTTDINVEKQMLSGLLIFEKQYPGLVGKFSFKHVLCSPSPDQVLDIQLNQYIQWANVFLFAISKESIDNKAFLGTLEKAATKNIRYCILIHDIEREPRFPNVPETLNNNSGVSEVWKQIAAPLVRDYEANCWEKVAQKLQKIEMNAKEVFETDIFLSHRQLTAQGIALGLYFSLTFRYNCKVFLDVKAGFELHELEQIVNRTKVFVLILSSQIFDSKYCLLELQTAVNAKKKIITVRDFYFQLPLPDEIPDDWKPFLDYIYNVDTVVYIANFVDQCADKIARNIMSQTQ